MAKPRPVVSVHVDIAEFLLEVVSVSGESSESRERNLGAWTMQLARALAARDAAAHPFAAKLLAEVENYRKADSERKRESKSKDSMDSGGKARNPPPSVDSPPRSDRSDRSDQSSTDPPPTPSGGVQEIFEAARKFYPGARRGFAPEWSNFEKKFGKRKSEILPLLAPAIFRYKAYVEKKSRAETRPPVWMNFKTWINQECWTT
jgi:hypothetical protein